MEIKPENANLESIVGRVAETNQRVGDWQSGLQVIVSKVLSKYGDPHLEVEHHGRKGSLLLSEIDLLDAFFEVF